jgi:carboxymethylenebutenolidase
MCHSDDSRAPAPPRRAEVGDQEELVLTAADGTRFAAFRARPSQPTGKGIVILPDIRGLHPFYVDLAQRFAEAGFDAIAIDYFGRTAGVSHRDDSFDWKEHIPQVTPEHVRADAGAASEVLRKDGSTAVFSVGFCFGGGHSWRLATTDLGLNGSIGFYGRPALVMDVIDEVSAPVLMLIAGNDHTPQEEFDAMDAALTKGGRDHEMHVYDGAPHSFFDRAFDEWKEACQDAWKRILSFTDERAA